MRKMVETGKKIEKVEAAEAVETVGTIEAVEMIEATVTGKPGKPETAEEVSTKEVSAEAVSKEETVPQGFSCLANESGIGVVEIILILVNILTI